MVQVEGLTELQRAFRAAKTHLAKDLRAELRGIAHDVAWDAEALATANIRNIGAAWSRMRVGVTARDVYVAPAQHGTHQLMLKRPNLAVLLWNRAMLPAVKQDEAFVRGALEALIVRVKQKSGF